MNFVGVLPSSKSLFNRALIAKSFFSELKIEGESRADDVIKMSAAVSRIGQDHQFDCGEAGTVLRFLALRLSREVGRFELTGSKRLFQRPNQELIRILSQLGVAAELTDDRIIIESQGWKPQGDTLYVPSGKSSQFLSAVVLSAWNLPFDLYVSPEDFNLSRPYFYMTQRLLEKLGMRFRYWSDDFCVLRDQKISTDEIKLEPDISSCFALAAAAAVSGNLVLHDFPQNSLQPDIYFIEILKAMGAEISLEGHHLKVSKSARLNGVRADLKGSPDLFPVLAALCATAKGPSELRGAPHLKFKESSRIEKIKELLNLVGCEVKEFEDGIAIDPAKKLKGGFRFDPEEDHRLAMAAGVLLKAGVQFELRDPDVVKKSFPEFWNYIGLEL